MKQNALAMQDALVDSWAVQPHLQEPVTALQLQPLTSLFDAIKCKRV